MVAPVFVLVGMQNFAANFPEDTTSTHAGANPCLWQFWLQDHVVSSAISDMRTCRNCQWQPCMPVERCPVMSMSSILIESFVWKAIRIFCSISGRHVWVSIGMICKHQRIICFFSLFWITQQMRLERDLEQFGNVLIICIAIGLKKASYKLLPMVFEAWLH